MHLQGTVLGLAVPDITDAAPRTADIVTQAKFKLFKISLYR